MKISEQTLKILKNFAGINPSILIRPGSLLGTQSIAGNIVAEAKVEEEFPKEFALYDLTEFLNTLKLFSSPVLDFREEEGNYLYICEEENLDFNVRYTFGNKKHLVYPKRRPVISDVDISFDLDNTILDSIIKASNVMQLRYMVIAPGKEGNIDIKVTSLKNPSSNKFFINVGGSLPENKDFKLIFKIENLKMLPGSYNVRISGNKNAAFESDVADYFIGLDVNSEF